MTLYEDLAAFVLSASYDDLSSAAKAQTKIRVLDSLGCAIGALGSDTIRRLRPKGIPVTKEINTIKREIEKILKTT